MSVFENSDFSIRDLRDYGYYVDPGEPVYIGENMSLVTSVQAKSVSSQEEMLVLESEPYQEGISMFAIIEESRGLDPEEPVWYYDNDTDDYIAVTRIEHDEIERALYLS